MDDLLCCKENNITVLETYNPDLDGTFVELGEDMDVIVKMQHEDIFNSMHRV